MTKVLYGLVEGGLCLAVPACIMHETKDSNTQPYPPIGDNYSYAPLFILSLSGINASVDFATYISDEVESQLGRRLRKPTI